MVIEYSFAELPEGFVSADLLQSVRLHEQGECFPRDMLRSFAMANTDAVWSGTQFAVRREL